jgi:hypothetical protein
LTPALQIEGEEDDDDDYNDDDDDEVVVVPFQQKARFNSKVKNIFNPISLAMPVCEGQ